MIRSYLPPRDYPESGGSSFEEMEISRRYAEYRERVQSAPEFLQGMLKSNTPLVRAVGACAAAMFDVLGAQKKAV